MKRVALWLALLALTAPTRTLAAAPLPTSARAVANGFLAAFNHSDRASYEAFLRAHWPGLKITDEYADMRAQTGGYDLVSVAQATPTLLVEVVKARLADDYFTYRLELDVSPGRAIKSLIFTPTQRPHEVRQPRRVGAREIGAAVDRELAAIGDFSGAVLIARNGRTVYARAEGLADRSAKAPNTRRTRFRIASMGKMFTAVAILQLTQAGKLDLDAPVASFLPDYPNAEFARAVTVRQLLTHTAGAGDFMSQKWADNIDTLKTPADYVALFGARPPEFKPGARFSYANYGFIVLGRIVEAASGQSYEGYIRDHIFRPAGMTRSGLNSPPIEASPLAVSYVKTAAGYGPPPAPFLGAATPAGGAYTTVDDLLAFAVALTRNRLLDRAHTELLLSPHVRGDDGDYAFGFEVRSRGKLTDVGHDGGGPGQNGGFHILSGGRGVVIALSNVAPTWRADKLCDYIVARLALD